MSTNYLSFSNTLHKTIADFNMITDEKYKTLNILFTLLKKNWINDYYSSLKEEQSFFLKALQLLINYYYNPLDKGKKTLLIEKYIEKNINNKFILCGIVDKCYIRNDNLIEIIDYKVSNNVPVFNYFEDFLQLIIYSILCKEVIGKYPNILSYYYLNQNKKIIKTLTPKDINSAFDFINKKYEEIVSEKKFPVSIHKYCSNYCEYAFLCKNKFTSK